MITLIGVFSFIMGAIGFIFSLIDFDLTILILTFLTMVVSSYLIKSYKDYSQIKDVMSKSLNEDNLAYNPDIESNVENKITNKDPIKNQNTEYKPYVYKIPIQPNDRKYSSYIFRVVGTTMDNDKGSDIQKLIKRYVADEIEMLDYKYDDMTNKEILECGDNVYEVDLNGYNEVTLELEPDNPYDSHAIKVIHEEIGHIGYVPKESTSKVKSFLESNCEISWQLLGGKMKYVDWDEDKVMTETLPYGVEITLTY